MASNEICFNCKNACGRCSWSKEQKPVDGWKAIETSITNRYKNDVRFTSSSEIISCPAHRLISNYTYSDRKIKEILGIQKMSNKDYKKNKAKIMILFEAKLRGYNVVPLIRSNKLIEQNKKENGKDGKVTVSNGQKTNGKAKSCTNNVADKRIKGLSNRAIHSVDECIQGRITGAVKGGRL